MKFSAFVIIHAQLPSLFYVEERAPLLPSMLTGELVVILNIA